MLWIDLLLALVVSALLSAVFLRFVHEHGPWRKPWAFALVVFLFAWVGGAWVAPGLHSGWVTYWIPFLMVGLLPAILIAALSPRHNLATLEDTEQFHQEEKAVLLSVIVLWWILGATLVGLIIAAYLR